MDAESMLGSVVSALIALGFVLVLAYGAIRVLKYYQDRNLGGAPVSGPGAVDPRSLRFLRAIPVGPRERVMLVEAEGERFLLGIGGGGVSLLARWPESGRPAVIGNVIGAGAGAGTEEDAQP